MTAFSDARLAVELSKLAAAHGAESSSQAPPSSDAPLSSDAPSSSDAAAGALPSTEQLLAAVASFHDLVRISSDLQGQAVRAAHDGGVSWAKIGSVLGTSRQAVQQRFDPNYFPAGAQATAAVPGREPAGFPAGSTRILGPVARAEEVRHLTEACAQGWRLIRSLHGEHVLRRDNRAWEVKRVSVFSARPMPSARDGWRAAATRFPDCFYIRPLQKEEPED